MKIFGLLLLLTAASKAEWTCDSCTAVVDTLPDYWARIAAMLWPGYYNPEMEFMCVAPGLCGESDKDARSLSCDECMAGIRATMDQLVRKDFIEGTISWLGSDEEPGFFCAMEPDHELCSKIIEELIPPTLEALYNAAINDATTGPVLYNQALPDTCPSF